MIDQRAQDYLDSLSPMAREALLVPYRNLGDCMELSYVPTLAAYEAACQRIELEAVERWAADFMGQVRRTGEYAVPVDAFLAMSAAEPKKDASEPGVLTIEGDGRIPWGAIYRQAQMYGYGINEIVGSQVALSGTPEPDPAEPRKQETWRDRPPML